MVNHYIDLKGFELRIGRTNNSNYNTIKPEDHLFELRIRNKDEEQIEALLDKIKKWLD